MAVGIKKSTTKAQSNIEEERKKEEKSTRSFADSAKGYTTLHFVSLQSIIIGC
jgi:hypothetical protein